MRDLQFSIGRRQTDLACCLVYQLKASKATALLYSSVSSKVAIAAAAKAGIPSSRMAVFNVAGQATNKEAHVCIEELIQWGLKSEPTFKEVRLKEGEAKTKIAFLCFSSG